MNKASCFWMFFVVGICMVAAVTIQAQEGEGEPLLPVAYFEASAVTGAAPLTVTFTNLSENVDDWYWYFGDGEDSYEWSPTHTFTGGGIFSVYLEVLNADGWDWHEVFVEVTGTPYNDECANAGLTFNDYTIAGTNVDATGTDINSCCSADTMDVWYRWTPGIAGTVYASLCSYHDFDTSLTVYDACDGTEIVCNDDYCGSGSQVSFVASSTVEYLIRVAGYGQTTGYFQLYTGATPPADPEGEGEPLEGEGEPVVFCPDNVLADGSFELGVGAGAWVESSTNTGSPICTESVCGLGNGTGPYNGDFWAWFGGFAAEETGQLYQEVVIPSGNTVSLEFFLEIPVADKAGFLQVGVDEDILFEVTEADAASYAVYQQVVLDLSSYADDASHRVWFSGYTEFSDATITSFFVDAICMLTEPAAEGEYVETICEGNLLWDGGFEQGSESDLWSQYSTLFGTPLCTSATCGGTGNGTGPYEGEWWAWFGGSNDATTDEEGFISQSVVIPESDTAFLSFWLEIPVVGNPGYLLCGIDEDFLFLVSDIDAAPYQVYSKVILDVSAYADGELHDVFFYSNIPAGENPTNFFVDAVCLTLDAVLEPPVNDDCANAEILLTDTPKAGTNLGALGTLISSCSYSDTKDVWYTWTPEESGLATVSLCSSSDFDTTLSVWDGCGGTELICNDDFCDLASELSLEVTAGTTYYIRVAGYDGEQGNFTLTASFGGSSEGEPIEGEGEPVDLGAYYRGDANLDGVIDFDDVEYSLDIAIDVVTPDNPISLATADVNRDGDVTSDDSLAIILFVKGGGLITEVPEGVSAESGGNQVTVFWEAVPHANLGGYAVYRRADGETEFQEIGTTTNTSFTDQDVETKRYTYYVVTVDVFGNEGDPSEETSVLANTVRVWLPEVWAMPGEQARIPINFGNARGLTPKSMIFNIRFDPNVMTFNMVDRAVLAQDVEFIDTVDETAGLLRIISIDPNASIIGGEGRFLDLIFDVTGSSGTCVDIDLERATLADTSDKVIATEMSSGQLCVGDESMWGDVNADSTVDGADAQMILDIVTRKVAMTPYHKKVGDLNGDSRLDSADAVVVLRLAADEPINPPPSVALTYSNETLALTIPDMTAGKGNTMTLPLSISNGVDVAGMDIVVSWPPDEFQLNSVALASAFNGSQLSQTSGDGFVRISFSAANAAKAAGETVVANLVFTVLGDLTTSMNPAPVIRVNHTDVKQAYGESHLWFGDIQLGSAKITIVEGTDEGEGEPSEGEEGVLAQIAAALLEQFGAADVNGDGQLDMTEAQSAVPSLTQAQFDTLDLNGDTFITEDELNTTLGNEPGGCCQCSGDSKNAVELLRKYMADWLLVGLSILILISLTYTGKEVR